MDSQWTFTLMLRFLVLHFCIHLSMIMQMGHFISTGAVTFKGDDCSLASSLLSRQNNSHTRLTASVGSARPVFMWPEQRHCDAARQKPPRSPRLARLTGVTLLCTHRQNESCMRRPGLPARLLSRSDKARCDRTAIAASTLRVVVVLRWLPQLCDMFELHITNMEIDMSNLREVRRGSRVNFNWIKGLKVFHFNRTLAWL